MTSQARGDGVAALVLGAGRGERLGQALPKAFVSLVGETLIARSLRALARSGLFAWIQPVVPAAEIGRFEALGLAAAVEGLAPPIAGGSTRQDSLRAGLAALPERYEWVAVHDAARCLVDREDLVRVVEAARTADAAILGERSRDTLKRVVEERIVETLDREHCWAAQTPQVARRTWLVEAVERAASAGRQATDEAQLLEWAGRSVVIVEARAANPKITRPDDLRLAEHMISATAERSGRGGPA